MRKMLLRLLHVGVVIAGFMESAWAFFERLFIFKGDRDRLPSARFKALERRESEIERLDRLRNPSDYRGR